MKAKRGNRKKNRVDPSHGRGLPLYYLCAMEQRLARQAHNLEVVGSIPTGATFSLFRLVVSLSFIILYERVAISGQWF